ncbi:phospholipid/cholesterol/gamma-HCH transport system substrate-binding protein [Herbihabitans rhizosphaerae]|uniref:Phospholipid/cholesterol/gamma-HCH transport system substrate-binding protein n=1 Tax=Herbihabitans rhizosphaerae TaxID=1872711 RepID=A0A4Q7KD32_9PSEU|nr:MCE family protein [Herbihabitans rhizosphaerae]RZS29436.1 phospholipid/cholesterol/gamma-HCH transport system substrate-binding protein [Herbihabitans rhizosphaerae]
MKKPFSERNPVKVGVIGALLMVLVGALTFYWEDLPLIGGSRYVAEFKEAAGLKPGDEVRVAGVKVGEVTSVELAGDHVDVHFRAKGVWLGDQTFAAIKIKTLLGQKNLVLDPLGDKELDDDTPIPRQRTITPYDVNDAFSDLAKTAGSIDTKQLAESLRVVSQTFSASTPETVRQTMEGLSALSKTISVRDQELRGLLANTGKFSKLIADRTGEFESLIKDGGTLLSELSRRREAIAALLTGTRDMSKQLAGLVADNQAQIGPALAQLERVTTVLQRNQSKLDESLRLAGPFYRVVGSAVGNGRWIDNYICGLVPAPGGGCIPPKGGR